MNLDYEVTLQDDLDAMQTSQERDFSKPWLKWMLRGGILFLLLFGSGFLFWGIINPSDPDVAFLITSGGLFLFLGVFLILVRQANIIQGLNRWSFQRKWREFYAQKDRRQIRLSETEFIFKTSDSETAWSWQALKFFYEGTNGFMLAFFSGHSRYISKRVFRDQAEIGQFKNLLQQYQQQAQSNESGN